MPRLSTTRTFPALISAFLCAAAAAQTQAISSLPPTSPTSPAPINATAPIPDAASRAHRAEVQYAAGLLSINANNSSLNQILRDIARETGMKITGGVSDERVFGHYGPATPAIILATLIDGTGSNMFLRQSSATAAPEELILTPRNGGPTPPNPNAPGFNNVSDDDDDRPQPPQRNGPAPPMGYPGNAQQAPGQTTRSINQPPPASTVPSVPLPSNNVNGSPLNTSPTASTYPTTNSVPTDSLPTPSTTPPASGIVDAPNPPDPNTVNPAAATPNNPTSPNGVTTPEQVFQQLQQMRQQQQQKSTTPQ